MKKEKKNMFSNENLLNRIAQSQFFGGNKSGKKYTDTIFGNGYDKEGSEKYIDIIPTSTLMDKPPLPPQG